MGTMALRCGPPLLGLRAEASPAQTQSMPDSETFGAWLKRNRLAADLTQRDLALQVGVGVPHISKLEADRERPGDELLPRLASVFKVDPDEVFVVARRLPPGVAEHLASDPVGAVQYFRSIVRPRRGDA